MPCFSATKREVSWGAAAPHVLAMLKIYAIPVSLYCAKLRILLRHKKLAWHEEMPPGGYGSAEYRTIVSSGNLPALVDADLLLADSEAIAEYLNEKFAVPAMLPDGLNERAKIRELSRFHDTRLEPALRALFPFIAPSNRNPEFAAMQADVLSQRLLQLATFEIDTARRLMLGDCGYAITFNWISVLERPLGLDIRWPDVVRNYRAWLEACPAVAAELADYRPKLDAWIAGQ